ncbi:hypothetical protein LTR08_004347 [Meristemomyces frigidus]|nr:hypothetical protein LTR08_004347 [Meristemomyces frigidus]
MFAPGGRKAYGPPKAEMQAFRQPKPILEQNSESSKDNPKKSGESSKAAEPQKQSYANTATAGAKANPGGLMRFPTQTERSMTDRDQKSKNGTKSIMKKQSKKMALDVKFAYDDKWLHPAFPEKTVHDWWEDHGIFYVCARCYAMGLNCNHGHYCEHCEIANVHCEYQFCDQANCTRDKCIFLHNANHNEDKMVHTVMWLERADDVNAVVRLYGDEEDEKWLEENRRVEKHADYTKLMSVYAPWDMQALNDAKKAKETREGQAGEAKR